MTAHAYLDLHFYSLSWSFKMFMRKSNILSSLNTWIYVSLIYSLISVLRQGFSVPLKPVLKLALIDQTGLELVETYLPLPSECWD